MKEEFLNTWKAPGADSYGMLSNFDIKTRPKNFGNDFVSAKQILDRLGFDLIIPRLVQELNLIFGGYPNPCQKLPKKVRVERQPDPSKRRGEIYADKEVYVSSFFDYNFNRLYYSIFHLLCDF